VSREIRVRVGEVATTARLNDGKTAEKILAILPFTAAGNLWGDEVYFEIPVEADLEDGQDLVALGDIAYWPQGKALCMFFGRTPIGDGDEIRPISPVTVVGRVDGDQETFRRLLGGLKQGEGIVLSR
jgi:hypothetical protein